VLGPPQDLQRQVKLYFRSVVNLNIFLADTLTLDQALLLNVACEWRAEQLVLPVACGWCADRLLLTMAC
jgi:hypothetical protein